ncbi:MAG TPA: gephyrin-like molybdotransferase Glp [Aggregatilineaceae bacterium]|nr:gephyrin-like molybdotransferase Glp [Aggregatilineaceae bacterium]
MSVEPQEDQLDALLTVDEVLQHILSRISALPAEEVPTPQALGRTLAEDIVASTTVPPFANSSMDGYAVRAADVATASPESPARLPVVMDIPAGATPGHAVGPREAARIMTGAPMPQGADAVIPVEQTDDHWTSGGDTPLPEQVTVYRAARPWQHVRPAGEDVRAGQTILRASTALRPQDIGLLVSSGRVQVPVYRQPRVAVLATGDELIDLDEPLTPGKIRDSNSYVLAGLISSYGGVPIRLPVARDTLDDVRRRFAEALSRQPDLIVSSAGVSVGTRDVVRTVVDELGHVDLWRVNLRPGKPLAFGHVRDIPFFGLPGNPVSAMVTFDVFVRPALLKQTGSDPHAVEMATAVLAEDIQSDGRRTYLRVRLSRESDDLVARTTGTQSSGALLSMVLADGLLIIPEGVKEAPAGSRYPVRLLRSVNQPR